MRNISFMLTQQQTEPLNPQDSQMSSRFPLKSVFETPIKPSMDNDLKWLWASIVGGTLFMLACLYGVLFHGWAKHIASFVAPLGFGVPCAMYAATLSKGEGDTGTARIRSLALGAAIGYVGGQILMAIFVLAWNIAG